ncbi:MAG TPA: hypothetical protein VKU90_03660 [Caulobacteraceae bacterium]|nr:hypothetical protein [Caulobacteraceae bacterium]
MSDAWALRLLRWSYCAFIAWASAQVFITGEGQHEPLAPWLAGIEIAAIAAFLFDRLQVAAAAALLIVYAVAAAATTLQGEPPLRFLFYAATAAYILVAHRRLTTANAAPALLA